MIILYDQKAINDLVDPITLKVPSEDSSINDLMVFRHVYNYLEGFVNYREVRLTTEDTGIHPDYFIKKVIPLTSDLLPSLSEKTEDKFKVFVDPLAAYPTVVIPSTSQKVSFDLDYESFSLKSAGSAINGIKVSPVVIDTLFPNFRKQYEQYEEDLQKKLKERTTARIKKGDIVQILSWQDTIEVCSYTSLDVTAFSYTMTTPRMYKGQLDYYAGKTAEVLTAHKDGSFTLLIDNEKHHYKMMVDGCEVILQEKLQFGKEALLKISSKKKEAK